MIVLSYRIWSKMNIKNSINFFYYFYEVHPLGVPSMHPKSSKKPITSLLG